MPSLPSLPSVSTQSPIGSGCPGWCRCRQRSERRPTLGLSRSSPMFKQVGWLGTSASSTCSRRASYPLGDPGTGQRSRLGGVGVRVVALGNFGLWRIFCDGDAWVPAMLTPPRSQGSPDREADGQGCQAHGRAIQQDQQEDSDAETYGTTDIRLLLAALRGHGPTVGGARSLCCGLIAGPGPRAFIALTGACGSMRARCRRRLPVARR